MSMTEEAAALAASREELTAIGVEIATARRRLQMTVDSAGAACEWEWDIAARRLTADARFAVITGQDTVALADGVPTSWFFHSIHPDDNKRIRLAVAAILAGAEVFSKEYRLLREDGGIRWVHATGNAVFDEDDQPIMFKGMLVDITAQKQIQERLRIAQLAGGIGTFEYVSGFGTISVSEQFCNLFGLHPTRLLPVRTVNVLINPEDPPIVDIDTLSHISMGDHAEFRVTRADNGEERWLVRRGEYVEDLDTPGRRYIGVVYDVTPAKQIEERLRQANDALADRVRESMRERNRMWENSRDLLAVVDTGGRIVDANPAWWAILGLHPHDVAGSYLPDFAAPNDRSLMTSGIETAIRDKLTNFEASFLHKDGTIRWISWTTSHDQDLVYAFGRHITVEKEQAEILETTEAQLRQSQKMEAVGQLTGGIAHDFNNMLTGVIGALSIIKRRVAAGRLDDIDKFVEGATTSAHRAASLTHRLLAFSRRQSLDRRVIEVNELVHSIEDLLHQTLGENIELATKLSAMPCYAMTDANQLESAILNLVINARDAMPDGGKLTIETSCIEFAETDASIPEQLKPGNYISLAVRDTGTGMPKDVIDKAFDPFFTTKPIGQGTGLGLSMIYGFAQQSGGAVRINSEVGRGTTLTLYLPLGSENADNDDSGNALKPSTPRGEGETVLIVEDDPSVRMLITEVLKDLGYIVLEAIDSNSAIPILESKTRIDLLISDVGLPGLNGRQLAEIALKERPKLSVLFVTGYAAMAASRADFLAPGMDMITKPFAIDDLAQRVREIITNRKEF